MGITADWGSSHSDLESQGDTTGHLSNITLSPMLVGELMSASAQGYQMTRTEKSREKWYSDLDYRLTKTPLCTF